MMKKNNKGFTLAELLIVVAIIGVLVAVAMPTFKNSLDGAKKATEMANARSTYGEALAEYLTSNSTSTERTYDGIKYTATRKDNGMWEVKASGTDRKGPETYTFGTSGT